MSYESLNAEVLQKGSPLTARSVVFGILIGTVTTIENIYFALKYGWTVTNNISAAILGFGVMKSLEKALGLAPFTPQENCVLMTVAVAATAMVWGGSMPFAILAMSNELREATALGTDTWEPTVGKLIAYSAALCFIGFCLAIPLRKKFVVDDPLPFPYAVAGAKTIKSLHCDGDFSQPLFLAKGLVPAMAWGMIAWTWDGLERVPLFGLGALKYSWSFNLSVAPLGRGFIVPARYVFSELLGAVTASGVLLPLAVARRGEWYDYDKTGFEGKDAYYLMPAILAVAFDSIYQLCKIAGQAVNRRRPQRTVDVSSSSLLEAAAGTPSADNGDDGLALTMIGTNSDSTALRKTPEASFDVPRWLWFSGWASSSLVALFVFRGLFNTRYDMGTIALLSSPLWSVGICLAVGTTGSNVASSCGKVMIMLFAAWYGSGGHEVQTLALGALSIAVIDQALDLVRDFKTAHLLDASPAAMFLAQSFGASVSIFTSSVLYYYYVNSVSLPNATLPAVIAKSYRGLAFTFAGGLDTLPDKCLLLSVACGLVAVVFNVLHDLAPPKYRKYCPSGVAFGVGIFILPGQVLIEVIGLACRNIWRAIDPVSCAEKDELLGAAFLAGDGLAGVLQSVLEVAGVDPPYSCTWRGWYHRR
ncbi:hypothetical protein CTAYLR_002389 [Chrysophaeum taylorii]|uniref:Oligopeptide transporter n=1 Tax=Chrysophaeum taylorii TaxID=2483200 RepID=A0AAD7UH06_9STRA|nr:hypothetical protein CTAYLR_002389 [Chrysophaeum taylorii]